MGIAGPDVGPGNVLVMLRPDGRAYYAGLVSCGSVWSCPVCAARVARHRAEEVTEAINRHREQGGAVYLVTVTVPHDQGQELRQLRRTVANGWRYVQSGRRWIRERQALEIVGGIRALEVTHGAHGWHPHLHVLLFTRRALSEAERSRLRAFVYARWCEAVERRGLRRPSWAHGVSVIHGESAGTYVAKLGLADELAGVGKEGRGGNRTPLAILADIHARGAAGDVALWRSYTEAMHGARHLTWTRGLRAQLLSEPELTDEEAAASDGDAVPCLEITGEVWAAAMRVDPSLACHVLELVERCGAAAAAETVRTIFDRGPPRERAA